MTYIVPPERATRELARPLRFDEVPDYGHNQFRVVELDPVTAPSRTLMWRPPIERSASVRCAAISSGGYDRRWKSPPPESRAAK